MLARPLGIQCTLQVKMNDSNPKNDGFVPSITEINAVMAVVAEATKAKRPLPSASPLEQRLERIRLWLASHAKYASVVMIGTACLALYTKSQPLKEATLALGILAQLLNAAMITAMIVSGSFYLFSVFRSPYTWFIESVHTALRFDLIHVEALARCQQDAVRYVLGQYKNQRNGYERRAGMLAGSVDKIGIFPALAGLVLLVWNLLKVPGAPAWGSFFGPILLAFYFMSIASAVMTQKMDNVIVLLEYSLQSRR